MIKKTCVKRAYKYWPKTERLEHAIHYLNTDGGQGIDLSGQQPAADPAVADLWVAKAKAAVTPEELTAVWTQGVSVLRAAKDMPGAGQGIVRHGGLPFGSRRHDVYPPRRRALGVGPGGYGSER